MILVIRDGKVIGSHSEGQNIFDKYPGCTFQFADDDFDIFDAEGNLVDAPIETSEQTRDRLKISRAAAVEQIVVTVNGKNFNGDEVSQNRMARAIIALQGLNVPTTTWVLSDNTPATVTVTELIMALAAAGQAQTNVWVINV